MLTTNITIFSPAGALPVLNNPSFGTQEQLIPRLLNDFMWHVQYRHLPGSRFIDAPSKDNLKRAFAWKAAHWDIANVLTIGLAETWLRRNENILGGFSKDRWENLASFDERVQSAHSYASRYEGHLLEAVPTHGRVPAWIFHQLHILGYHAVGFAHEPIMTDEGSLEPRNFLNYEFTNLMNWSAQPREKQVAIGLLGQAICRLDPPYGNKLLGPKIASLFHYGQHAHFTDLLNMWTTTHWDALDTAARATQKENMLLVLEKWRMGLDTNPISLKLREDKQNPLNGLREWVFDVRAQIQRLPLSGNPTFREYAHALFGEKPTWL